jgi:transposase-like protein
MQKQQTHNHSLELHRCTHWEHSLHKEWNVNGVQRYRCKNCKLAFSDKVRKFTYTDKERCIELYLN